MDERSAREPFRIGRTGIVLAAALAVLGFLLLAEHAAHLYGLLPYILILACPLMHFFHHGGGHGKHDDSTDRRQEARR